MDSEITKKRQLTVSDEVAVELRQRQADLASRQSPPRPGDIFLSRNTAAFPVEWLVVEDDEDGRFLVVALDDHPFAGSRDLELSDRSLYGAAVVRCGLDAWVGAEDLEPELRTGTLTRSELDQVRKRRAIDEAAREPTLLEQDVDGDPEYQGWRDSTLRSALAALTRGTIEERTALSRELERQRARIAELKRELQTLQERLAASETDRKTSASEVGRLEAAMQTIREASESALAGLRERLRRALENSVELSPLLVVLAAPGEIRAADPQAQLIELGDARRLTLSLQLVNPEPYPRYRLTIVRKSSAETIWQTDELFKSDGQWLRLGLPVDLFEAEEYELLIYGLGEGEPQLLQERYTIKLES